MIRLKNIWVELSRRTLGNVPKEYEVIKWLYLNEIDFGDGTWWNMLGNWIKNNVRLHKIEHWLLVLNIYFGFPNHLQELKNLYVSITNKQCSIVWYVTVYYSL